MYTINVIDTKTDGFVSFETEATTFGGIKSALRENGFEIDFNKRTYVIAETETEILGDDSSLMCCEGRESVTLCIYPKDTKAGLSPAEIEDLGFAGMRRAVKEIKETDKAGWEKHLSHLGGNPSSQGLKDSLNAYYKSKGAKGAKSVVSAPAKAAPALAQKPATADSPDLRPATLEERVAFLEKRVNALEASLNLDTSEAAACVDPKEEERRVAEAKKREALERAKAIRRNASKRF